jgi:hypothetical protein
MEVTENHPVFALVSSKQATDQLAQELADHYVEYLDVDISQEQERYQDTLEECLSQLEEVVSALDDSKQNGIIIDKFLELVNCKQKSLSKLYAQEDAIGQYIFEAGRLLDQLDDHILDMERHQSPKASRIKHIIGLLPGMINIPACQVQPIEALLSKIRQVELSVSSMSIELSKRLHGDVDIEPSNKIILNDFKAIRLSRFNWCDQVRFELDILFLFAMPCFCI